jgi:hypothetical protein
MYHGPVFMQFSCKGRASAHISDPAPDGFCVFTAVRLQKYESLKKEQKARVIVGSVRP